MEAQYLVFENYITDNLSKEEIIDFENKLQNDISFKDDFIAYKDAYSFLENKFNNESKLNDFKENLHKISDNHFNDTPKKRISFFKYGAVASILLILGLFLFNNTTPTYEKFITYPSLELTTRSNEKELLNKAEASFNNKNFKEANILFTDLLKTDTENTLYKLYKGFALIELDSFKEADTILMEITREKSAYINKALWYMALSKLKQKDFKSCKTILKKIPKGAFEHKKALQLINKL